MKLTCRELPLEDLLYERCDADTETRAASHLENCPQCQQRLTQLAADPLTWAETAENLASAKTIRLAPDTEAKLAQSSAFVVPTSEFRRRDLGDRESEQSTRIRPSWTQLLDPPRHPEMLGQIDQFDVESKIGQGGMGIVLKAHDRELDRAVAIKVLSPHLASNGTARKRFAREAQAAAAVVHANVVPIYSVNQSSDRPYIVMQLVSGQSLQCLVESDGPRDPRDVVRIAIQIADGLAAAHQQGLIHRDVKPANVLTERDASRVMITDFGLARAVDDAGMTQTGWLAGTPHYMSPEQARGDDLDPRSDLFSLGSLMYFLATGREPFRADRPYGVIQKIIHDRPTAANVVSAEVPQLLSDIIGQLLEKEPAQRFSSAKELSAYLREYLAHLQHPSAVKAPVKPIKSTPTRVWQKTWLQSLLAVAALCSVALAAWWFNPPSVDPPVSNGSASVAAPTVLSEAELDDQFREAQRDLAELEQLFQSATPDNPFPNSFFEPAFPTRSPVAPEPTGATGLLPGEARQPTSRSKSN